MLKSIYDFIHLKKHRLAGLIINWVFRLLFIAAALVSAYHWDLMNLALSVIALFLTFLPGIISKKLNAIYPLEFEIILLLFIYASMYLGEIKMYYLKFWWWDIMLHSFSGLIISVIGFSLVYILNKEQSIEIKLSPKFIALFAFCFALAIGALWEIFEFSMDSFFRLNMQKSGLVDTMWDLIVDAASALVVCTIGYFYMIGKVKFIRRFEKRFLECNPRNA
ncbi:MAG: hypothetical protein PHO02_05665 [Candidatus Nanoarchaeia archaeon]|nr:hypothetical protein [Candidatus Nanoarchaeia archaeon]